VKIWKIIRVTIPWVLQILMALMFVLVGIGKFADPSWARKFAHWGYPDGFYMVIGAIEALAGLALLVPRLASYAAFVLMSVMVGAVTTHAVWHEGAQVGRPVPFLVLVGVVAWLRWRSRARRGAPSPAPVEA
jgi:uncharacterized membrane protein YphA (DoxX/SURF4 family)